MDEYDMKTKNAQYIGKNLQLLQEFHFAHPSTKLKLNQVYNSHYSGSVLWDLFSPGSHSIESSYNRSVKVMLDLPLATHRALIEPLTDMKHVKTVLMRRFLGFMEKIDKSEKKAIKTLKKEAMADARSVTGSNYRQIMFLLGLTKVDNISIVDTSSLTYHTLSLSDQWKIQFIKEIIDIKEGGVEVAGFDLEEIQTILEHLCTG